MELIVLGLIAYACYYFFIKKRESKTAIVFKRISQNIAEKKTKGDTGTFVLTLENANLEVFNLCKKVNILEFKTTVIPHFQLGERRFVYPQGTIGGGHLGVVKKEQEHLVGEWISAKEIKHYDGEIYISINN